MILDLFDDLMTGLEDSPYYSQEHMDLLKKALKKQGKKPDPRLDPKEESENTSFMSKAFAANINKNIYRTDDKYVLEIVLAGYEKNELDVSSKGNELKIQTNDVFKKKREKSQDREYVKNEYTPLSFEMAFGLPKNADKKNISVALKNGILRVEIPLLVDKQENIKISIL